MRKERMLLISFLLLTLLVAGCTEEVGELLGEHGPDGTQCIANGGSCESSCSGSSFAADCGSGEICCMEDDAPRGDSSSGGGNIR